MNDKPIIIVITPIRNEAWVLDAFLTCTSSWADYIILADQHSDDGSREIAARYEKVILVDNDAVEMNQAAARLLLFQEVDKIVGDKIVMALDADEFLSKGFDKTEGWKRILESKPDELFCFKWLNLYGDFRHVISDNGFMEWGCHFAPETRIADLYYQCEKRAVHEMRIPCMPSEQVAYIEIPDIVFVHLARLNLVRQKNKEDFYQVSSVGKLQNRFSAVSAFRLYYHPNPATEILEQNLELYALGSDENMAHLVMHEDYGRYYIEEMKAIFQRDGIGKYLKLDIWNNPYLKEAGINPKMPLRFKLLHCYLRKTQSVSGKMMVRIMDKVLKQIC